MVSVLTNTITYTITTLGTIHEPSNNLMVLQHILEHFRCSALYFLAFPYKSSFVEEIPHTGPRQKTFFYLRLEKGYVGPKNNYKQLLRQCCYTHFCPFGRKMIFECAVTCYQTQFDRDRKCYRTLFQI